MHPAEYGIRVVDPGQQEVQVDSPGLGDPQPPRVGVGHRGGGGEFPLSLIPAEQPAQLEREHQLRLEPGSTIAGSPYQPLGEQAVGQQRGSIGRGEQQRRVGWQVTVHCEHRMPQDVRMIVGAGQRFDKLAPQPPGPHRVHSSPHRFPVQRVRQPGLPPPAKPLYRHQAPVGAVLDRSCAGQCHARRRGSRVLIEDGAARAGKPMLSSRLQAVLMQPSIRSKQV